MTNTSLFSLCLLLFAVSCNKASDPDPIIDTGGGGSVSTSTFTLTLDVEQRTYNLGETIPATLRIDATGTAATDFVFSIDATEGDAAITVNKTEQPLGVESTFAYTEMTEKLASRTLVLAITPRVLKALEGDVVLTFCVQEPDTDRSISKELRVHMINATPLTFDCLYNPTATGLTDALPITIQLHKNGYEGYFHTEYKITKGEGSLNLFSEPISQNTRFALTSAKDNLLDYTPTCYGTHRIEFTVADSTKTLTIPVEFTIAIPDGVYILSTDDRCYTPATWAMADAEPRGVAVIDGEHRLLVSLQEATNLQWLSISMPLPGVNGVDGNDPEDWNLAGFDYAGKSNTAAIMLFIKIFGGDAPAAAYCASRTPADMWYLPALGELLCLGDHRDQINACMEVLSAPLLAPSPAAYVSSTEGYNPLSKSRTVYFQCFYSAENKRTMNTFIKHTIDLTALERTHIRPVQTL